MLKKLKLILAIASLAYLTASCTPAYAGDFVCSGIKPNSLLKSEVIQLYIGERISLDGKLITVLILPFDDSASLEVFNYLGISKLTLQKRMNANSLVDNGIRIVRTPEELMSKLPSNRPSIGYTPYINKAYEINKCF